MVESDGIYRPYTVYDSDNSVELQVSEKSDGHIDCRANEQTTWFGPSRVKHGIPNQITCSPTLVLLPPTNDKLGTVGKW